MAGMETSPDRTFRDVWPTWRILTVAAFVALSAWFNVSEWRGWLAVAFSVFLSVWMVATLSRDWWRLPRSRVKTD